VSDRDELAPIPREAWPAGWDPWAKSPELSDEERAEFARLWGEKEARNGSATPPRKRVLPPSRPRLETAQIHSPTKENPMGETKPEGSLRLPFAPISEVLRADEQATPWLVPGYVSLGALTLWSGWPKVGKSTLLFALISALQEGTPFLGLETKRSGVLLLTEERRGTLASKVDRWNLNGSVYHLRRQEALGESWAGVVHSATACCHENSLEVLIVDTFSEWARIQQENDAGEVLSAIGALQEAAGMNLAVQIAAHQRKSPGQYGQAVRGSNALTGAVDIVIELERSHTLRDKNMRVLRAVSRFDETPEDLVVALTEDGYEVRGDSEHAQADEDRRRIFQAIQETGSASTKDLAELVGLPNATVNRHAAALFEAEQIGRTGSGRKGDAYTWHSEIVSPTLDSLGGKTLFDEDG
jgi:DNA-binding Lrp family transcriptional regulator